jgi:hypothetical protein
MLSENVVAASEIFHKYFLTLEEHFIAYCMCIGVVKLVRFLLPPWRLRGPTTMCRTAIYVTAQENFM